MEPGQIHRENAGFLIAASSLEDRFHETNRIGRMELKLTDLILKDAHRSRVYPRSAHQVRAPQDEVG